MRLALRIKIKYKNYITLYCAVQYCSILQNKLNFNICS